MKQTDSVKTLLESLANAQAEFVTLPKDKNGYNYKYTDLDTVISTVKPVLAKNKLGFMQSLTTLENGKWAITTRLFSASGEWIEDTTPLPDVSLAKGNAAQNVGAAITYMKRYTLCAMLGISSDEDPDGKPDGNFDDNRSQKQPQKKPAQFDFAPKGGEATPQEKSEMKALFENKGSDGNPLFTKDEIKAFSAMRKDKTAQEVIALVKAEIQKKLAPAPVQAVAEAVQGEVQQEIF